MPIRFVFGLLGVSLMLLNSGRTTDYMSTSNRHSKYITYSVRHTGSEGVNYMPPVIFNNLFVHLEA